mgnify:CR=1 FL=1|jgi:integrase
MANKQSTKRKDSKGRILKTGESQRKDGMYVYKYQGIDGKPKFLYSWRLTDTDPLPRGKRPCKSLREKEEEVLRDNLDGIDSIGKKMTLCELYEKHNNVHPNVRKTTESGRKVLMDILKADILGNTSIDKIKSSDAKEWAIRLKEKGYAYQTINNHKRSLTAAFYTAISDDLVRKNPFLFKLADVIENDTPPKTALTDEQVNTLLSFVQADKTYQRYYRAIVVLLHTGLRISELCGLTVQDIDFEKGYINVTHQLQYDKEGYRITPPKTENSIRKIPMMKVVKEALREEIRNREKVQFIGVDGYTDFIFLNQKGLPMYATMYSVPFSHIVKKYNKSHKDNPLPSITPHTLRHTFCTNMARKKMTPNTLQYIMGHKNITMTLGYYTHGSAESAKEEMEELAA